MRKVVIHGAGSYDQLKLEEHPTPQPTDDEVVVNVEAIGVNYADCIVRMGLYESAKKYVGWPITPGFEVTGTVDGKPVIAVTRFGGYTSELVVSKDQVFELPQQLTKAEGAGFPAVFLTAWYAMHELAHPRPGSTVLVHSAAGGVGGALLQLARLADCQVVGVVGASHKVQVAKDLGAHHVIDKSRDDLWTAAEQLAPNGYDIIFDANGVATLQDSYDHLAAPGKLIVYGFHTMMPRKGGRPNWLKLAWGWLRTPRFNPLAMTGQNRSVLAFNLSYLFENNVILQESMTALLELVRQGKLVSPKVTTYPFSDVANAHRDLEGGQTVGKLVLLP